LSIAGIEAYPTSPSDGRPVLKPGKISFDMSTIRTSSNYDATATPLSNALDGNADTFTHTKLEEEGQWWEA